MGQFVDVCILCGCDFCGTVRGVGPKTALAGVRRHGSVEAFLATLNGTRHTLPDPFPYR